VKSRFFPRVFCSEVAGWKGVLWAVVPGSLPRRKSLMKGNPGFSVQNTFINGVPREVSPFCDFVFCKGEWRWKLGGSFHPDFAVRNFGGGSRFWVPVPCSRVEGRGLPEAALM